MSLPHASQEQIRIMNEKANKMAAEHQPQPEALKPAQEVEEQEVEEQEVEEQEEPTQDESTDSEESQDEEEVVEKAPAKKSNRDNIRMLREKAERAERERDELLKTVMNFNKQQQPDQQKKPEPEVEEDYLASYGLDEDSLIEGKHFKLYLKKQKELERELKQYKKESVESTTETRLKSKYPDFDKVVSADNLAKLRDVNPTLSKMILNTPNLYDQASMAYDIVKQFGIYKDNSGYVKEKEMAIKNSLKPKSMSSLSPQQGTSPLSKANAFAGGDLTPELKAQLVKEMNQYKKGSY